MTMVEEPSNLLNSAEEPILTEDGILNCYERLGVVDRSGGGGSLDKQEIWRQHPCSRKAERKPCRKFIDRRIIHKPNHKMGRGETNAKVTSLLQS